jgi:hypothetical protein
MSSWFTDALKAAVPALRRNLDRSVAEAEADRLDRALARNRGNTITPTGPIRVTATPATQPAMPRHSREDQGMTDTNDLAPWLREQIAEDRAAALMATSGPWRHDPQKCWRKPGTAWCEEAVFAGPPGADAVCIAGTGECDDPQSMIDARHIARHDPRTVLAQCDAHEAILEEHWDVNEGDCATCVTGHWGYPTHGGSSPQRFPCKTVRILALAYQHRPGYLEEWRP